LLAGADVPERHCAKAGAVALHRDVRRDAVVVDQGEQRQQEAPGQAARHGEHVAVGRQLPRRQCAPAVSIMNSAAYHDQ